jgi:hypothetical protein
MIALVAAALGCGAASLVAADPATPERIAEDFAAAAAAVVRRAEAAGASELAAVVRGWDLPAEGDRQIVLAIPPRPERPAAIDTPQEESLWEDFMAARRTRAAGLFGRALEAARPPRDPPRGSRGEQPPDARPCAAVGLVYRALRDDPDHAGARAAAGWVRRKDGWAWPAAARRLDRGDEFDPAFGWLPRGRLARYRDGQRHDRGRWISAADDAVRELTVERGRQFDSDHWEILSPAPLEAAAAVARRLEETRTVWLQIFGAAVAAPADFAARLAGRGRPAAGDPFAAVLCRSRGQYAAELEQLEPAIAGTEGLYWRPTETIWFSAEGDGPRAETVWHEATHQLFAEAAATSPLAGERCGFWAIEAAACHLESIRPAAFGWTVGGPDAGRLPAARRLLVEEEFQVPLEELAALGRAAFQADPRLERIYDQLAGLADFLMNGRGGRYREAFVQYLRRVYAGTDDPDTLPRLCGRPFAELDAEYRRHLAR